MKKYHFTLAILLFCILIIGCKKALNGDLKTQVLTTQQSFDQQYAYVKDNLKAVMKELAPVAKNKEFVQLIHSEVAKKFDGGYEVLIKTLVENSKFSGLINTVKMQRALEAFKNIAGENYYPQIYIPNYEKLAATRNASRMGNEGTMAEFVYYDGNEQINEAPSYVYNEEGEIIPTGTIVNEQ